MDEKQAKAVAAKARKEARREIRRKLSIILKNDDLPTLFN